MGEAGRVERERRGTHPEVLCRADELVLGGFRGEGAGGVPTRNPVAISCLPGPTVRRG